MIQSRQQPLTQIPKHVGIRNSLHSWDDEKNDYEVGFVISYAEDIEEVGWKGIIKRIRETVGDNPVYSTRLVNASRSLLTHIAL